jgi:putative chitinase
VTKATDNETFVRLVQSWLGTASDGHAGPATLKAWHDRTDSKPTAHALEDPAAFFAIVRQRFAALTKSQVSGFETLLKHMAAWDIDDTAYGLATAWWETNKTMQPVREAYWLDEAWRKKNLRYWPWYGRGYPQTTWEVNYARADKELGLGGSLLSDPDRMLEPEIAARTMVRGMEEGWFTGKKNSDYAPADYVSRRAIINGKDHAHDIAAIARVMEEGLTAGAWGPALP